MKKILRTICLTLCLMATLGLTVYAEEAAPEIIAEGKINNDTITWKLDEEGLLIFEGTGGIPSYDANGMPWVFYRNQIKVLEISDGITSVGSDAFNSHTALEIVKLGRDVASLGARTFANCPLLTELTLSDALDVAQYEGYSPYSFNNTYPDIVYVPASVTYIDPELYNLSSITEFVADGTGEDGYFDVDGILYHKDAYTGTQTLVKVPHSMELDDVLEVIEGTHIIGEEAAIDNDSFTELVLCDGMQAIKANAFQECDSLLIIDFANGLATIGTYAFHHCDRLLRIDLPDTVTTIEADAFKECGWLSEVILGRGVATLGARAFADCPMLTAFTLSDALDVAQYEGYSPYSFANTYLSIVYVPATATYIDPDLYNMTSITSFVCYGTDEDGFFDIDNVLYHKDTYTGTQTLVKVPHAMDLPDTFTVYGGTHVIGEKAVFENDSFTTLELCNGLTIIKANAFEQCDGLLAIDFANGLTTIGTYAFHHCDRLLRIDLPDTVTAIQDDAFKSCGWLSEVVLGHGVTSLGARAFADCPMLTKLTLSDALDVAQYEGYSPYSFANTYLSTVYVPATATYIDHDLYNMTSIQEFVCDGLGEKGYFDVDGVLYYKDGYTGTQTLVKVPHAMDLPDTFTVYEGTHVIGEKAVFENDSFTTLKLCNGLTTIKTNAFEQCDGLQTIDFARGLTTIASYAFHHCDQLLRIDLPDTVTAIQDDAFKGCGWLEEVVLGRNVATLGARAFADCPKLTKLTLSDALDVAQYEGYSPYSFSNTPIEIVSVPATVKTIEADLFKKSTITAFVCEGTGEHGYFDVDGVLYYKDKATGTQTLLKASRLMDLPDTFVVLAGTHIIGDDAVSNNDSFTDLVLPDGLRTIGNNAFNDCDNLLYLEIPDTVTTVGDSSFYHCDWLSEAHIGSSVTSIGRSAFDTCKQLTHIFFRGDAPSLGRYALDTGAKDYALWYPEGASGWTTPTWNYHPAYPYTPKDDFHAYRINGITVSTLSGEVLGEIPDSVFHVTVSVTNQIAGYDKGAIMVASYTADGRFCTWNYVVLENCPTDVTVKFTMPIDNRSGDVGALKAFVTSGTGSMEPLGDAVEFRK